MNRLYILLTVMVVMVGALFAGHQALAKILTGTAGDDTLVGTDGKDRLKGTALVRTNGGRRSRRSPRGAGSRKCGWTVTLLGKGWRQRSLQEVLFLHVKAI
jgi:hypothetical protein